MQTSDDQASGTSSASGAAATASRASNPLLTFSANAGANYQTMAQSSSGLGAEQAGNQPGPRLSFASAFSEESTGALQRSGSDGRRPFEAARQDVVRDAVVSQSAWTSIASMIFLLISCIVLAIPLVVTIYVEVMSWHILILYYDKPCDQNLAVWLMLRNLVALTAPAMPPPNQQDEEARRQRRRAWEASVFYTIWLLVGYSWVMQCRTCKDTNPELYEWVRFITIFGLLVHFVFTFFQLIVMLVVLSYHFAVGRGWIKSPNAANNETIELMTRVDYSPEVFPATESEDGQEQDGPPSECCCCMESFGPEKDIVQTPCGHVYHYACLKEWLLVAKTCPICRQDLDVAVAVSQP
mmetsp:Transcript_21/g.64  ORF Transcript_21/g.64 Transcript_21/m.64 type:complete len:353 (-) Transcript_21:115-1173(-)